MIDSPEFSLGIGLGILLGLLIAIVWAVHRLDGEDWNRLLPGWRK